MDDNEFEAVMQRIISALREAGYNPDNQLTGYVQTGDVNYITRKGQARALICRLDLRQIKCYLENKKFNKENKFN